MVTGVPVCCYSHHSGVTSAFILLVVVALASAKIYLASL